MNEGKVLQLRDVAEMIRKANEPKTVIKGLGFISDLINAAPDELVHHACKP